MRELSYSPVGEYIPRLLDIFADDFEKETKGQKEIFVVMEYVDGVTLKEFLDLA